MPSQAHSQIDRDMITEFCRRNHIKRLSLFGSVLTDRFGSDSDIDFLVEFEPGAGVSLLDAIGMEQKLEQMLGRKMELRTPEDLSRYFRDDVVRSAELLYAA